MKAFWYTWKDAETGKMYGESTDYDSAMAIASKLANEPVINNRQNKILLFQEPGSALLQTFNTDGSVEIHRKAAEFLQPLQVEKRNISSLGPTHDPEYSADLRETWARRQAEDNFQKMFSLPHDWWHKEYFIVAPDNGVVARDDKLKELLTEKAPLRWYKQLEEAFENVKPGQVVIDTVRFEIQSQE